MNDKTKSASAANINMVAVRGDGTFLGDLRALMDAVGPNKNERAIVLIEALIGQGIDDTSGILDVANRLNFTRGHVPAILNDLVGNRDRWAKDENGRFRLVSKSSKDGEDHA